MTLPLFIASGRTETMLLALGIVLRAGAALFMHGLRHPFRTAVLCRASGRVTSL